MRETVINTENQYVDWFIDAGRGDVAVYHSYEIVSKLRNLLCDARARKENDIPTNEARELNALAHRAYMHMKVTKKVDLVQRRRNGINEYLVVKR
jgi:hypothetical protein